MGWRPRVGQEYTMFGLGTPEILALLVLGLLLFGRRLPEVGRNLGKGIVEFKRGLKSVEDEVDQEASRPSTYQQTTALPKNEPKAALNPPMRDPNDQRVSRADVVE